MSHPTSQATIASRQERGASRILDDERLRGDLADDEFQPLLDWALAETDRIAASTVGMPDEKADALIDKKLDAIREVVRAAGAAIVAHGEGDSKRRDSELAFVGKRWKRGDAMAALVRAFDGTPDLTGAELATHIVGALGTSNADRGDTRREEKRR